MDNSGRGVAVKAGSVRHGSLGRFESATAGGTLTDSQRAFVEAFCSNGGHAKDATRQAGYEGHHAPARLLSLPHVRHAIRETLERKVRTEGASLAWGTLLHLMADPSTPSAVRFQCARWTLEAGGIGGSRAGNDTTDGKSLSEMSLSELEQMVKQGREAVASLTIIDATPSDDATASDTTIYRTDPSPPPHDHGRNPLTPET
jgi:hypothetical protein